MKKELISIGNKSKKAITSQLDSKKKNKVLKDYCDLIKKNRKGSYVHFKIKGNGNVINELEKNESIDKKLLRYLTVKVKNFDLETNYFEKKDNPKN